MDSQRQALRAKPGPKADPVIVARDRLLYSLWQQLNTTHTRAQIGAMVPGCEHLSRARLSQILMRERERQAASL